MICDVCKEFFIHWTDGVFEDDGMVPGTTIHAKKWICKPCKLNPKQEIEEEEPLF